jgi:hypothetical protein
MAGPLVMEFKASMGLDSRAEYERLLTEGREIRSRWSLTPPSRPGELPPPAMRFSLSVKSAD